MGSSQASPQRSSLEANATAYSNRPGRGGRRSLPIDPQPILLRTPDSAACFSNLEVGASHHQELGPELQAVIEVVAEIMLEQRRRQAAAKLRPGDAPLRSEPARQAGS